MASENKKAESLCKNMSGLCGASCAFLSLEPDIKLSCVGEDWLCSRYCGCDYCNTLHYGFSAGEDTAYYCDLVGFREVPEFLGQEIKIQEREEEELEEL